MAKHAERINKIEGPGRKGNAMDVAADQFDFFRRNLLLPDGSFGSAQHLWREVYPDETRDVFQTMEIAASAAARIQHRDAPPKGGANAFQDAGEAAMIGGGHFQVVIATVLDMRLAVSTPEARFHALKVEPLCPLWLNCNTAGVHGVAFLLRTSSLLL